MLALGTYNSTFSGRSQSDGSARGKAATLNSRLGDSWIWVDEEPRGTWKWTLDMFEVPLKGLCWGCQRWGEGCRWCWGGDRKDIRKQHILTKGLIFAASVDQLLEEEKINCPYCRQEYNFDWPGIVQKCLPLLKVVWEYFYRTRVRSLVMLVTNSLTHSLTDWLLFSKLDWCDPGVWRCQLKTCSGCYSCWCWCWGSCWHQFVDLGADVWF